MSLDWCCCLSLEMFIQYFSQQWFAQHDLPMLYGFSGHCNVQNLITVYSVNFLPQHTPLANFKEGYDSKILERGLVWENKISHDHGNF